MNTIIMNAEDSMESIYDKASKICDEGIIYINETPFSSENDITRFLTLSKKSILKTGRGYIFFNQKNVNINDCIIITYDDLEDVEIKENFGIDYMKSRMLVLPHIKYTKDWDKIINMYNNIMINNIHNTNYKIPQIMHFIYVVNPPPSDMKKRMELWKNYHPNWTIKFWGDREVSKLTLKNRKQYDKAVNPGEKSDILRYEILYNEGGVYIDQDFDCLGNINIFNKLSDFWCGCAHDEEFIAFNGLMACAPKHKLVEMMINNISKLTDPSKDHEEVQTKTGPYFFSKMIQTYINNDYGELLVLPPTYFYPTSSRGGGKIQPESYGNHLWGRSWVFQKYHNKQPTRTINKI